jgi:hypothetical protein
MEGLFSGDREMLSQVASMAEAARPSGRSGGGGDGGSAAGGGGSSGGASVAGAEHGAASSQGVGVEGGSWGQASLRPLLSLTTWLPLAGPSGIGAWSRSTLGSGSQASHRGSSNRSSGTGGALEAHSQPGAASPPAQSPGSSLLVRALTGLGRSPAALGSFEEAADGAAGGGAGSAAAAADAAVQRVDLLLRRISAERAAVGSGSHSDGPGAAPPAASPKGAAVAPASAGGSSRAPSCSGAAASEEDLEVAAIAEAAEALGDEEARELREWGGGLRRGWCWGRERWPAAPGFAGSDGALQTNARRGAAVAGRRRHAAGPGRARWRPFSCPRGVACLGRLRPRARGCGAGPWRRQAQRQPLPPPPDLRVPGAARTSEGGG